MIAVPSPVVPSSDVNLFFKALADDTRLDIVRLLVLTDLKAGEIVTQLHAPQNAVSYHLRQLRAFGLLRDRQSSFDARDVYYSVDLQRLQTLFFAAGDALHPGIAPGSHGATSSLAVAPRLRVLFLCTHNSARSQMAEGIMRQLGGDQVEVASAGTAVRAVHPLAIQMLDEWGIDASQHTSKTLDQYRGQSFDYVITVCDRARESCPVFPGDPQRIHWSFPDPTLIEDPKQQLRAFRAIRAELATRIRYLLNLPHPKTGSRLRTRPADPRQGRAATV